MNENKTSCAPADNQQTLWDRIDWTKAELAVRKLQARIVKAQKEGRYNKVKALQWTLTHSFYAKALAVKRVTSNGGGNTPGVDMETWEKPEAKTQAISELKRRGYQPKPLRRVHIKKSNGKLRPLGIPTMKDRAMQALYLMALEPVSETTADSRSYGFRKERRCIILNYVALLGWSPKGDLAEQEIFTLDQLVDAFELSGVSKSPAIFDIEKLTHFNALYLRAMAPEEFAKVAEPYIRQTVKDPKLDAAKIAGLLQARCEKLTDIPEKVDFFDALPDYDVNLFANKKSKSTLDSSREMLSAAIGMLANLPSWSEAMIHDSLVGLAEGLGVKNALLMWPVRIAAAGKSVTPGGAVEICHILGREETVRRLKLGLDKLSSFS